MGTEHPSWDKGDEGGKRYRVDTKARKKSVIGYDPAVRGVEVERSFLF
jgi:hypothetical protein